jgi:subtilisin family serine protease
VAKLLTTTDYLFYVVLTNYMAVLGGVLLWVSFFFLGLIARRLERAFETPTGWRLLLWAPSGILLYTVYTLASAGSAGVAMPGLKVERGIAYGALFVSAAGSLYACAATWVLLLRLALRRARQDRMP